MRKECEQHYTLARDNQYRSTARYYADNCPYCGIDRLTAQLAEANERCRLLDEKAGDWQHRYAQETMCLQSQLAGRDAEIKDLRVIKAVHKALINNTNIAEDERIEKIAHLTTENAALREEVGRLKERLEANAAKIDDDDVVIEWSDYIKLKEGVRKQTAQDCVDLCCKTINKIITSNVGCGDYKNNCAHFNELEFRKQAKKKFGLEG